MSSARKNAVAKRCLNISGAEPGFGSKKLAGAVGGALTLWLLFALTLIAAIPARAQTETVLYNFTGGSDEGCPYSPLTSDGKGNFYGTTPGFCVGYGTVFELSPNGDGGWDETTLLNFDVRDGLYPSGPVIFDGVGNLYGITSEGGGNGCDPGAPGCGLVFELSPGGPPWTENVLFNFDGGAEGVSPHGGVVMDSAGNLYGANSAGVFELSLSGGSWTEQVIYSDTNGVSGVTMDAAGNIFGADSAFGGVLFELSPNGNGGWNPTVIHTFGHGHDGSYPSTPAFDGAGNLYGTTSGGGAGGNGTVYELSPGRKEWTEKILHSFKNNGKDGFTPVGGVVLDADGNIYGTTADGGKDRGPDSEFGTVFELEAQVGAGKYKEKILWSFNGTDGAFPYDRLILDGAGNLYGTTSAGGTAYVKGGNSGYGVVFDLAP